MKNRILESRLGVWWSDATRVQQITVVVSFLVVVGVLVCWMIQLSGQTNPIKTVTTAISQDVNVASILNDLNNNSSSNTTTVNATAEVIDPKTYSLENRESPVVGNAASAPVGTDYYKAADGSYYDSEQVFGENDPSVSKAPSNFNPQTDIIFPARN